MRSIDLLEELYLLEETDNKQKQKLDDKVIRKLYNKYLEKEEKKGNKYPINYPSFKQQLLTGGLAAVGLTGLATGGQLKYMIGGTKNVYHGTRELKWGKGIDYNLFGMPVETEKYVSDPGKIDNIYKHGLKTSYGGSNVAAADQALANAGMQGEKFKDAVKDSKNGIHFSTLKGEADYYGKPLDSIDIPKADGKTFKIKMGYDQLKNSRPDEKVISAGVHQFKKLHPNSKLTDEQIEKIIKRRTISGAKITSQDIAPEQLADNPYVTKKQKREFEKKQFKNYVKNHKIRFGLGVAGAAALATAGGIAAYKLIKNENERKKAYNEYVKKGGKEDYKTFKTKILKEAYCLLNEEIKYKHLMTGATAINAINTVTNGKLIFKYKRILDNIDTAYEEYKDGDKRNYLHGVPMPKNLDKKQFFEYIKKQYKQSKIYTGISAGVTGFGTGFGIYLHKKDI